jgi:AcrR family transcriptional regulator
MARPSRNIDRELIRSGRELLQKSAISDLSLRQVADHAKANLGMFHYHFKTKDEFIRAVLNDLYEEFFGEMEKEFRNGATESDPVERLRKLLVAFASFAVRQRELLASVIRDVMAGNPVVLEFIASHFPRHIQLLGKAIQDGQKKGVIREDLSVTQILVLAAASLNAPSILGTSLSRATSGAIEPVIQKEFLAAKAVEKRIDFVLRGLRT